MCPNGMIAPEENFCCSPSDSAFADHSAGLYIIFTSLFN